MVEAARVKPKRNGWLWLMPLVSLCLALALSYQYWSERGVPITLQFKDGHGIQPGDTLKYRGITVGKIESVLLHQAQENSIEVVVRLTPQAKYIAKTGSLFWVNRPQLGVGNISGLDALAGARYIQVLPGKGASRHRFIGLEATPLNADLEPGGIEVTLQANRLGGLRAGAPIRYRQISIGKIIAIGLSSDASAVEAQAYIQPKFLNLIRSNTRFWRSGGIQASAGLSGFSFKIDSLTNAILGGVAMAVPETPGKPVHQGHRFKLHADAEEDWLAWKPTIALGNPLLPKAAQAPKLERAILRWKHKAYGLVEQPRQRSGWVLQFQNGWLGPSDVMRIPESAMDGTGALEVAGLSLLVTQMRADETPSVRWISGALQAGWDNTRIRVPLGPEDCVIIADHTADYRSVAAVRMQAAGPRWTIDPMVSFDRRWHGAAVLAAQDGKLLGLLWVVEDGPAKILLLGVDPVNAYVSSAEKS